MSPDDLTEARALNDQAVRFAQDADFAAAHPLLRRAAELYIAAGAQRDPDYVAVLRNLAAVAQRLGNNEELRDAWLQVAAVQRLLWPETDPQRGDALDAVAASLYEAGDDATAEALVTESLDLRRRLLGEQHPEVAISLNNLGHLRIRAGDLAGAREAMERAESIRAAVLPEGHPDLADSWSGLGGLALSEGDGNEAEEMFARALGILAPHFGPDDPQVARTYEDLARARLMRDDRAGALLALGEAVEIHGRNGAVGEGEARALNNLADAYYGAGAWDGARELYGQASALLEDALGPDDAGVADVLNNLANAERERGASKEAFDLYERVLQIQRRHGDDDRVGRVLADIAELREREAEPAPEQLLTRALTCERDGDYPTAERLARRAVEHRHDVAGRDDEAVMEALLILGNVLSERADHMGARAAYTRALTAAQTWPDADYTNVGALFAGMGNLEYRLGDPSAAEAWHRRSLDLLDAHGGPRNPAYPKALRNLAIVAAEQGELLEAAELLERSCELLELQGEQRTLGSALTSLGRLRLRLGDTDGADAALQRALELLRRVVGDRRNPDVADTLAALADTDVARGEPAIAEARLREALEILERTLCETHPRTLAARRRLAVALQSSGDGRSAEALLLAALSGQREQLGNSHPEVGVTLVTLGNLYASSDRRPEALPLLTEGAELLRSTLAPEHPSVVAALASVGSFYARIGASDAAEYFLHEALDGAREGQTRQSQTIAQITATLAILKRADGDLDGAAELLSQALDSVEPDSADLLAMLASVRAAQGATLGALDALERAFVQREDMFADVLTAAPERTRLALLASQRQMLALLLSIVAADPKPDAVDRAFDVVLRQKALAAEIAVAQRHEILSGRHPELTERLRELARMREREARALLRGAPAAEAATLREHSETLERSLASRVPEIMLTRRVRSASRASIVSAMPAGSATIEIVQHVVDDLSQRGGQTVQQLFERRAGYVPMRYLAFVLGSDAAEHVQLVNLGDAPPIDEAVARFRKWITGDPAELAHLPADRTHPLAQAGEMLHAAVMQPLERVLGGVRRLFIAPDGDLTRLPFEALPDRNGGHLIDRFEISYLSAARDVVRFGAAQGRRQSAPVVVADPDFNLRAPGDLEPGALESQDDGPRFGRLAGTREEGAAVADLLGAQRLFGYRAVKSAIKAVHAPKVLHLATHGWFLADRPMAAQPLKESEPLVADVVQLATIPGFGTHLVDVAASPQQPPEVSVRLRRLGAGQDSPLLRSGVALAGANTWLDGLPLPAEAENGLLTAADVAMLDLFGTDLVVLSACETGLGEVVRGEGVFGLRRAFVLAGASTLVMSLWKVPDDVTAELMANFYRCLKAGAGPAEALRHAQLTIRASPDLAEPYYWAAFVCQGDPGLPSPSNDG